MPLIPPTSFLNHRGNIRTFPASWRTSQPSRRTSKMRSAVEQSTHLNLTGDRRGEGERVVVTFYGVEKVS
jgi:hypothetical protein